MNKIYLYTICRKWSYGLLFFTVFLLVNSLAAKTPEMLKAGCSYDDPPYSIVTRSGMIEGFSVDLLKYSASKMGMTVRFTPGKYPSLEEDLITNKINVLPKVAYSEDKTEFLLFSEPYLLLYGGIYIRNDEENIKSIKDLKDKNLIVIQGDETVKYLKDNNVTNITIESASIKEAFENLTARKGDAIILQKVILPEKKTDILNVYDQDIMLNWSIKPLENDTSFFIGKICFAVSVDRSDLISTLNKGLAEAVKDGTYDRLYNKWFSGFESRINVKGAIIFIIILIIIIIKLFLVFGIIILKRQVRNKNNEVNLKNSHLIKLQKLAHIGNWELDLATKQMVLSNEQFRLLGLSPSSSIQTYKSFLRRIYPPDIKKFTNFIHNLADMNKAYSVIVVRVKSDNGNPKTLKMIAEGVKTTASRVARIYGFCIDLTGSSFEEN